MFAAQIILGAGQEVFRFAHGVSCVAISPLRLGDGDSVARLQQIVWSLGVCGAGGKLRRCDVNRILPTFDYVEFGVDRLLPTFCVRLYDVFENHHIARPGYGKIRLGRDDDAEGLQVGAHPHRGLPIFRDNLAQADGTTLRGDGPQYIRQVFGCQVAGWP